MIDETEFTNQDCFKGFVVLSQSFYAETLMETSRRDDLVDEITIGWYDEEGGTLGEFNFRWTVLGGKTCVKIEAFDDAWRGLAAMPELLQFMSNNQADHNEKSVTPEDMILWLKLHGYKDLTSRIRPGAQDELEHYEAKLQTLQKLTPEERDSLDLEMSYENTVEHVENLRKELNNADR